MRKRPGIVSEPNPAGWCETIISGREGSPIIEGSEVDGAFNIRADFSGIPDATTVKVEFAEQGVKITSGTIERYVPIPTDADDAWASVNIDGTRAHLSIPTKGSSHGWREIAMW